MDEAAAAGPAGTDTEIERLRRERDALRREVAALTRRRALRPRLRRGLVAVLLVMGIACTTSATAGGWARRNLADTDVWMDRVATLPDDPAVRAAIDGWLGDRVVELVDPRRLFAEVLPERGRLLALPLGGAVEDFIRERVDRFVASDRFAELWVAANERAHRAAVRVLRGESDVVQARGDVVVIDLVPAIDAVLAEIGAASPELLGRQVDLPDLRLDDVPGVAVERLEDALGIRLPDAFGQLVVYDRGRLRALQDGVEQARRWLVVVSVLAFVSTGAALWLSDRRRRIVLQLLGGLALGLALIRRLGLRSQRELLAAIEDATSRDAARAVTDRFLDPLLATTRAALVVLALVAVVVVLTGPYAWAVRARHGSVDLVRRLSRVSRPAGEAPGSDHGLPERAAAWVGSHDGAIRAGGVMAVVVVLLLADLSFIGLVVLAGLGTLAGLGAAALGSRGGAADGG